MKTHQATSVLTDTQLLDARRRLVLLLGFMIVMIDGYDSLMMSFLAPLLTHQLGLAPEAMGKLFAVGYLGTMVGAIVAGTLADQFGRKPLLLASLALAAVATALCAWNAPPMLMALRFVAGLGLGGALPTSASLIAEHTRPERRSGVVTLVYIGYPFGAVVGGAVTAALLQFGSAAIFLGAGAVTLGAFLAAQLLPESLPQERTVSGRSTRWRGVLHSLQEQLAEGRLWPALLLWISLFSLLTATYLLVSWAPTLLVNSGISHSKAALGGVLLNVGGVIGALCLAPIVNRWQPYLPAAAAVAFGAALMAVLGSVSLPVGAVMLTLFFIGSCIIGGQLNFPAMAIELYPQHVRAAGTGWTMAVGRLGSIAGPMLGGTLIGSGLSTATLLQVAAVPPLVTAAGLGLTAWLKRRR